MTKYIILFLVISLTGNVVPVINVLAIVSLLALYVFRRQKGPLNRSSAPVTARRFLLYAYIFWITSYVLTGAPLSNFFSYEFLRFDGAILIAYLPLVVFVDYSLDANSIRRMVCVFLTILSATALLGAAEFADALGMPTGLSRLPESLQMVHLATSPPQYVLHGLFRAHNSAGAVFALAACIALAQMLYGGGRRIATLSTIWFAATFIGLSLSKSRTAYTAFVLASALLMFSARKQRKKVIKIVALIVLPLSMLLLKQPEVSDRVEAVTSTEDPNVVGRFLYFERSIDDFVKSPIVGIGFGRYNDEYPIFTGVENIFYTVTNAQIINSDEHSHNSYLHFLAEGGIIGFALMMGVWISTYRWAVDVSSRLGQSTFEYGFARGVRSCVILEFFLSFTEHSMGTAVTSLTIFSLVGLLSNLIAGREQVNVSVQPHFQPPRLQEM